MAQEILLQRWFEEVWNERREAMMEVLSTPDIISHGVSGPNDTTHGLDAGFRPLYHKLLGAFPDIHFTIEAAIRQGDTEAVRWSARMTHKGDHLGIPATHKSVAITGMCFVRIAGDKIAEAWDNWDMMGLMNQLGQTPHQRVIPA